MTVEVCLLGTGTPMPDPARCGSGTAVVGRSGWVLVDCGRGVPQRVVEAGLDLGGLRAVLLTHHHSDHVSDLATLATLRWAAGHGDPLLVIAPEGPCATFARCCLDVFADESFLRQASRSAGPRPTVAAKAFGASPDPTVVFDGDGFVATSALVDHHPIEAAVGYRIEVGGITVAVSGDTAACASMEHLAHGADLLVHEAVLAAEATDALLEWNASAGSVGSLASTAAVGRLVLTHLLPPPPTRDGEQRFVDEARAGGYAGPIDVAHDLARITLGATPD